MSKQDAVILATGIRQLKADKIASETKRATVIHDQVLNAKTAAEKKAASKALTNYLSGK
jgi:hypothetical protein